MPDSVYSFGHFRLAPSERELLAAGQPLHVGGRAFDLLVALVQGGGRVMSKDELMSLAWPRLVVEENNLKVQIVTLRKLLGHPAIGTVPGRGYRFALPITHDNGLSEEAKKPPIAPSGAGVPNAADASQLHGNLPSRLPLLFGRSDDLAAIKSLLLEHTLVTVSGAGGIGKTRLSQAVAAGSMGDYPDGIWWIELAPLSQATLVAATVAETLRIDLSDGRDPTQAVLAHARGRRLLLVLDNCEHLLEAVASFATAACGAASQLRLLVTSQEVLRIPTEQAYRLGPLTLPPPGVHSSVAAVAASGAGALFLARARAADSRFELSTANSDAVVEICRRLDGIPLAIELAAARLPLLGVEGLRARLNQRFSVLTAGSRAVLRRHQTLRAALDWSHGLLSADEQAVFRRLGVFAGGFTLECAQRVAQDDGIDEWDVLEHLGALVDKSLVMADGDPMPRYRLLETTRLFALEQLGVQNETDATLRRHAQAMVSFIEEFERVTHDRAISPAEESQLAHEVDNVRAALEWLEQAPREASELGALAIELGGLAGRVLEQGSGAQEAFDRTLALRARINVSTPPHLAARYWSMLAELGVITAREESYDAAGRGATLYEQLHDDVKRFRCLVALIAIGARRGLGAALEEWVAAAARIEPAAARPRMYLRWARYRWLMSIGRFDDALDCGLERARIARDAGMWAIEQFILGDMVADSELALGRSDSAETRSREALAALSATPGNERLIAHVVDTLTRALVARGAHDDAIAAARRAVNVSRGEGYHFRLLEPLALNAAQAGRSEDAARICGFVDAIYASRGEVRWPDAAARRAALDALLAQALDVAILARLRVAGSKATIEETFARAFGDS